MHYELFNPQKRRGKRKEGWFGSCFMYIHLRDCPQCLHSFQKVAGDRLDSYSFSGTNNEKSNNACELVSSLSAYESSLVYLEKSFYSYMNSVVVPIQEKNWHLLLHKQLLGSSWKRPSDSNFLYKQKWNKIWKLVLPFLFHLLKWVHSYTYLLFQLGRSTKTISSCFILSLLSIQNEKF